MRNFLTLICCCSFLWATAQGASARNQGNALLVRFNYGIQFPEGDLSARFGNNLNLGGGFDFMTQGNNLIYGLYGTFLFGNQVNIDVLAPLRTPEGEIIGNDKDFADLQLRQRGFYLGAHVGKLFGLAPDNPRSGIRVTLGAGLLQHKIRIQDDPERTVPQLEGDYRKGYDRLTNGLALRQFVGYQLLSRNKRINFYAGVELIEGFTQNRRDFNFDTRTADNQNRFDLLFGLQVGWILPFYVGQPKQDIYY